MHLEESMPTSGGRKWDQFASNEAKFGLTTDYAEELYTTELDARWADRAEGEAGGAESQHIAQGPGRAARGAQGGIEQQPAAAKLHPPAA